MKVLVYPGFKGGSVEAPASKSAMQRACALALLHKGKTVIHNPGCSNDDKAAVSIIQSLGASVIKKDDRLEVISKGIQPAAGEINCGESGLSIRMFTPIASLADTAIRILGSGSLLKRPMHFFDEVLPLVSVSVSTNIGFLPMTVNGPLKPKNISIDGSLSSQFLTGMMMAFADAAKEKTIITVKDLKSKPYIDLTLQMMQHFGYHIVNNNYETFEVYPLAERVSGVVEYRVEGDWSGAAFLLVAAAIAGDSTVTGLDVFSAQADRAVLQALMDAGAVMSITTENIVVRKSPLQAFHFNATDCPDLFPPLVALAACCNGRSVIEGVERLLHKESNRAVTLQQEFAKLGVEIQLQDDLMIISGAEQIKGADAFSHHDHRIAMALAVAALRADAAVTIDAAEAVNKSYPDFFVHLEKLGAKIESL